MLPRLVSRTKKTDEATGYGILAHYWKETGETDDGESDLDDVLLLERKIRGSGVRRERYWQPDTGRHEVSFALNLRTLELKRFGDGVRQKALTADEWKKKFGREWLTGTVDWIGETDGIPWIDDFKTGKWKVDPGIKQIISYGLFDWIDRGKHPNYRCVRSVTQWGKYPLMAPPRRTYGTLLTTLELEEHLDDLRWVLDNPDEVNPVPIGIGPWDPNEPLSPCSFCACREPMPAAEWLNNFRYRAAPHCMPGMLKRINERNG